MFIVTGANGQLGRRIVEQLLTFLPPNQIGACVRDPSKATDLSAKGVSLRQGDFSDPASLPAAFAGATRLLLVSSNAAATGGDPLSQHHAAISAAKAAGVSRIFYTSQIASAANSLFAPARDHAATEAMLAASGLHWTALRHGFYAASGIAMIGHGIAAGTIAVPEDGRVSWTSHDDLARADALFLAGEVDDIDGPTPPLTGPEALDFAGLAALASRISGRPIGFKNLTDAEMIERSAARGVPPRATEFMMGYFRAARAAEFATIDPTLERLLGRPPHSMEQVMRSASLPAPAA